MSSYLSERLLLEIGETFSMLCAFYGPFDALLDLLASLFDSWVGKYIDRFNSMNLLSLITFLFEFITATLFSAFTTERKSDFVHIRQKRRWDKRSEKSESEVY